MSAPKSFSPSFTTHLAGAGAGAHLSALAFFIQKAAAHPIVNKSHDLEKCQAAGSREALEREHSWRLEVTIPYLSSPDGSDCFESDSFAS